MATNIAAKVRQEKEAHPERFCPQCLWRIVRRDGTPTPCERHPRPDAPPVIDLMKALAESLRQRAAEG